MKYHINEEGTPGPCSAKVKCRFGSSEEHYSTPEAASKAYEEKMEKEIISTNSKKDAEVTTNVSFENQRPGIEEELNKVKELALGPKQGKINELLYEAINGEVSNSGRLRRPTAFTAMEKLTKAARLIGAQNPEAKKTVNELIKNIENSTDVKRNSFYQSSKILQKTRLPAGATRRKELRRSEKYIELANGNEVRAHIPLGQAESGIVNFALTDPLGKVIKTSHNIKELF